MLTDLYIASNKDKIINNCTSDGLYECSITYELLAINSCCTEGKYENNNKVFIFLLRSNCVNIKFNPYTRELIKTYYFDSAYINYYFDKILSSRNINFFKRNPMATLPEQNIVRGEFPYQKRVKVVNHIFDVLSQHIIKLIEEDSYQRDKFQRDYFLSLPKNHKEYNTLLIKIVEYLLKKEEKEILPNLRNIENNYGEALYVSTLYNRVLQKAVNEIEDRINKKNCDMTVLDLLPIKYDVLSLRQKIKTMNFEKLIEEAEACTEIPPSIIEDLYKSFIPTNADLNQRYNLVIEKYTLTKYRKKIQEAWALFRVGELNEMFFLTIPNKYTKLVEYVELKNAFYSKKILELQNSLEQLNSSGSLTIHIIDDVYKTIPQEYAGEVMYLITKYAQEVLNTELNYIKLLDLDSALQRLKKLSFYKNIKGIDFTEYAIVNDNLLLRVIDRYLYDLEKLAENNDFSFKPLCPVHPTNFSNIHLFPNDRIDEVTKHYYIAFYKYLIKQGTELIDNGNFTVDFLINFPQHCPYKIASQVGLYTFFKKIRRDVFLTNKDIKFISYLESTLK